MSEARVGIKFRNKLYDGWVTVATKGRTKAGHGLYRLWFSENLQFLLKDVFLMSYMRDIEGRLRKQKNVNIENEIPFWEFLDIEFDPNNNVFIFTTHYLQKPSFPELFKRMVGSPILHRIEDELEEKSDDRIHKREWKPREELETEIGAENVLYMLIDTKKKLLYMGQAKNLIKRLLGSHPEIKDWDYYRYSLLPNTLGKHRIGLERMLIRDFASILTNNKDMESKQISDYKLANKMIDSKR